MQAANQLPSRVGCRRKRRDRRTHWQNPKPDEQPPRDVRYVCAVGIVENGRRYHHEIFSYQAEAPKQQCELGTLNQ